MNITFSEIKIMKLGLTKEYSYVRITRNGEFLGLFMKDMKKPWELSDRMSSIMGFSSFSSYSLEEMKDEVNRVFNMDLINHVNV